jgi:hypothetical protein
MAANDWNEFVNSLNLASVARGVTAGLTPPNGGASHIYGWRALNSGVVGVTANYCSVAGFDPIEPGEGGQITGAVMRQIGDKANMSVFLAIQCQSNDVLTASAYMLGISAGDPGYIMLRKGTLIGGLPDDTPGSSGVLRKSSAQIDLLEWVHLRLDCIVNPSGDVILNCYQNNLAVNPVTTPIWAAIPGMPSYNDDVLGVNSGSPGITAGGRVGYGFFSAVPGVVGAVDHITIAKTSTPIAPPV